jgi:hypothetical protein
LLEGWRRSSEVNLSLEAPNLWKRG